MARNFHNLEVWKLGYELALDFYKMTPELPEDEKNNITSQIRRAAVSVPLNIAEGSTRFTKKGYLQFLNYAYGSVRELEVLLLLCSGLNYINEKDFRNFYEKIDKLSKKLFVFINKVKNEEFYDWYRS